MFHQINSGQQNPIGNRRYITGDGFTQRMFGFIEPAQCNQGASPLSTDHAAGGMDAKGLIGGLQTFLSPSGIRKMVAEVAVVPLDRGVDPYGQPRYETASAESRSRTQPQEGVSANESPSSAYASASRGFKSMALRAAARQDSTCSSSRFARPSATYASYDEGSSSVPG